MTKILLLDDIVLSRLFHPEYMDFELANRCETVSSLFQAHVHRYRQNLTLIDLKNIMTSYVDREKLLHQMLTHCPNIRLVKNINLYEMIEKVDLMDWLAKLGNLKQLHFSIFVLDEANLKSLTNNFPNVKSLAIDGSVGFDRRYSEFCEILHKMETDFANKLRLKHLSISCHIYGTQVRCRRILGHVQPGLVAVAGYPD